MIGLLTYTRILTWYSIVTILLRCPSTADLTTDTTPKICKPYFQARSALIPHLEPYYNTYASQYVEAARPYYDNLDKRVFTPATALSQKYAAPRIAQAQAFGQAQWDKSIQPQVSKYQTIAKAKYDETLAPHLNKAYTAAAPYYDLAKTNAYQTYYGHILPTYTAVQPYALKSYGLANDFVFNTAVPYSRWAWTSGAIFLERTVFPQIRILYGENVEPQLVRIGERLGRYRDGKKLQSVVNGIDRYALRLCSTRDLLILLYSSSSSFSASSTYSSVSSSLSSVHATPSSESSSATATPSEIPKPQPPTEKEIREKAQEIVAKDLKTWQEKFAKAADEGSDELEERVTEITDRLTQNQAQKVGGALNVQLEETVKSSLSTLKKNIISIVESSKTKEEKEDDLATAVRKAGVAIKDKAQAVRTWKQNHDREADSLIGAAAQDTFQIIDGIRDLGLQEIGMRWAWTDGITHKDWTKYHQLKGKFDEWRDDVEKVVTEHPGLGKARAAAEAVENKAMDTAEEAAKELARIKETGRWKISTDDSSDDWTTKVMPAVVANAGQNILSKASEASEAVAGTSQGTLESITSMASASAVDAASSVQSIASDISDSASSVASSISSSVIGTSQGSVESVISVGSASASSMADQASSSIVGTQQGSVESVTSVAKASISSIVDQASSSVIGTSQGTIESIASVASDSASSLSAKASSSIAGSEPGVVEKMSSSVSSAASDVSKSASSLSDAASSSLSSVSSQVSSASSSLSEYVSKSASEASSSASSVASSASSTASKKVWGGAYAQHVDAREIIFEDVVEDSPEDDDSYSEKIQNMASAAGDRFSDITNAVSEALLKPTSTAGNVETVTVLAAEKYSSALSAASVALYGTEQGTGESIASVVTSRYADAVSA